MLRMWFFTVFSEMMSSRAISRVAHSRADQPQHLHLAVGQPRRRALLPLGSRQRRELGDAACPPLTG